MLQASIPSPSDGDIDLGPLTLRAYGLMIALAVLVGVWVFTRRFVRRGYNQDQASWVALWAVVAGFIGARAYHVLTDWKTYQGDWGSVVEVWEGGLGIPGAVMLGAAGGLLAARLREMRGGDVVDAAAVSLPLAQAVGRLGNWFNQELFGGPTDLPWGLEIDAANRPFEHPSEETFHPTFLYEAIWNLLLAGVLLRVESRRRLRPGGLFMMYVLGYSLGRLWVEMLRVDPASQLAGVRVNIWLMSALALGSAAVLLWQTLTAPAVSPAVESGTGDDPADVADATAPATEDDPPAAAESGSEEAPASPDAEKSPGNTGSEASGG